MPFSSPENIKDLYKAYNELEDLFMGFVKAMVNALDAKSPWTRGHSERVTAFAQEIAYELNLSESQRRTITIASLLHDIGKIGTYGGILDKSGKLTCEEYELIKKHPVQGAEILRGIKHFDDILDIIRHHHEKLDGSGYPDGLKGESIPLGARIVHVADAFDTMTEDRPYRAARSIDAAVEELKLCTGSQFDPRVVEAWIRVLDVHSDWLLQFKNMTSATE